MKSKLCELLTLIIIIVSKLLSDFIQCNVRFCLSCKARHCTERRVHNQLQVEISLTGDLFD